MASFSHSLRPDASQKMPSLRSLADLQKDYQQKRLRSLADLQKEYQHRQSEIAEALEDASEGKKIIRYSERWLPSGLLDEDDSMKEALPDQPVTSTVDEKEDSCIGTLRKVFEGKGYGFIAPSDGSKDVFVHFRDIVNGGSRDLIVGAQLKFELTIDESRNRKAKNATLINPYDDQSTTEQYSRAVLLSVFRALRTAGGSLEEDPGALKAMHMPCACASELPAVKAKTQHTESTGGYKEQKSDELTAAECILTMEAWLSDGDGQSKETIVAKASGDSTPTGTGDTASEREYQDCEL